MTEVCNITENRAACPCPGDCPRHGKCCQCIQHHLKVGGYPYCIRLRDEQQKGETK